MKPKWFYVLGAGGLLLGASGAGHAATPSWSMAGRAMPAYGSASLGQHPPSGLGESERLAQLRTLVHQNALHCGDPSCPICNPQLLSRATPAS